MDKPAEIAASHEQEYNALVKQKVETTQCELFGTKTWGAAQRGQVTEHPALLEARLPNVVRGVRCRLRVRRGTHAPAPIPVGIRPPTRDH